MVRPPRSPETIEAQKAIDKARALLGSPSQPPEEFEKQDELTQPNFTRPEPTTHGGRKSSLPDVSMIVGEVSEAAHSFKDERFRLAYLLPVTLAGLALLGYVLWAFAEGKVRLESGPPQPVPAQH